MKSLVEFISESMSNEDKVDLGLPSKTIWVTSDFKQYSFDKIKDVTTLPTKEQFEELIKNCKVEVKQDKNIVTFTSKKNDKMLILPLNKGIGNYWSQTDSEGDEQEHYAYCMTVDNSGASVSAMNKEKKMYALTVH